MSKISKVFGFGCMAVILGIALLTALDYWASVGCTIQCGHDTCIVITKDSTWEMGQPVYYEVRSRGQTVVPRTCFHDVRVDYPNINRYELVSTLDGDVIGLRRPEVTDEFELIHQFSTNFSWPYDRIRSQGVRGEDHMAMITQKKETLSAMLSVPKRTKSVGVNCI